MRAIEDPIKNMPISSPFLRSTPLGETVYYLVPLFSNSSGPLGFSNLLINSLLAVSFCCYRAASSSPLKPFRMFFSSLFSILGLYRKSGLPCFRSSMSFTSNSLKYSETESLSTPSTNSYFPGWLFTTFFFRTG